MRTFQSAKPVDLALFGRGAGLHLRRGSGFVMVDGWRGGGDAPMYACVQSE
jgi:hypothetical protein